MWWKARAPLLTTGVSVEKRAPNRPDECCWPYVLSAKMGYNKVKDHHRGRRVYSFGRLSERRG